MSLEEFGASRGGAAVPGVGRPAAVVVRASPRFLALGGLLALVAVLGALLAAAYGTGYSYGPVPRERRAPLAAISDDPSAQKKMLAKLRAQQRQLLATLQKSAPKGLYVVVDQTQNRIYVRKDEDTLLQAVCSAGSGMILREASGGKGRKWVFDTPRGLFKVKSRQENPVWKKPDWAFVEEGKPIPRNDDDRFDYGTLGEYAFYLGDGYMIHGTLYERLLGRSVTHGCIRVGREDLRKLWQVVQVGTPVYIY